MELHPLYGVSIPEKNWVPAPRYLLRRDRILHLLKGIAPGSWLEIGCGAGALLLDLSRRQFRCAVLEHSPEALTLVDTLRQRYAVNLKIYPSARHITSDSFSCIGAFEVLEHIEDDAGTLHQWANWLSRDGRLFLSVPAHTRKWSATDSWAGHYRRYEKPQLHEMLAAAGLHIERFECYGFPLANIIDPFRARMHAAAMKRTKLSSTHPERPTATRQSGISRETETALYPLLKSLPGRLIMKMAFRAQRLFLHTDLGNGYLVVARKA